MAKRTGPQVHMVKNFKPAELLRVMRESSSDERPAVMPDVRPEALRGAVVEPIEKSVSPVGEAVVAEIAPVPPKPLPEYRPDPGNKPGRPRKDFFERWTESGDLENNLAIVQSMSMQGKTIPEIADFLGMSPRQLRSLAQKHQALNKAIKSGRRTVVAMCQNKLMERVSSGDTTAIIYALKIYGGEFFNMDKNNRQGGAGMASSQVQIYLPATDSVALPVSTVDAAVTANTTAVDTAVTANATAVEVDKNKPGEGGT